MLGSNLELIIALIYFSKTKIRDKFVPSLLSGSEVSSDRLYLMQIKNLLQPWSFEVNSHTGSPFCFDLYLLEIYLEP